MNHPDELIAQLRILGRLEEFGSGARFKRRFQGAGAEERIHWHLRRTCFVRRLKKRRAAAAAREAPGRRAGRAGEREGVPARRARRHRLAAGAAARARQSSRRKVQATLRAERLAQLNTLRRLAARGKLGAALAWIDDFLASEEPLVVFAGHREIQEAGRRSASRTRCTSSAPTRPSERDARRPGLPGARTGRS